jgi:hypothetical protein
MVELAVLAPGALIHNREWWLKKVGGVGWR